MNQLEIRILEESVTQMASDILRGILENNMGNTQRLTDELMTGIHSIFHEKFTTQVKSLLPEPIEIDDLGELDPPIEGDDNA